MPGPWTHLAARFFDVVSSRPLTDSERTLVEGWLEPDSHAAAAFFSQSDADQRHGLTSARYAASETENRPDLVRAALLHDIGKRHAELGVVERVLSSVVIRLGLPVRGRWALYRDHGRLAAAELAGEPELVRRFAFHHHEGRPAGFAAGDWDVLMAADRARVGGSR